MKKLLMLVLFAVVATGLTLPAAEARRLGGGASIGKQRSSPAMNEASKAAPNAAPKPGPAAVPPSQAAAPVAAPPAKPGFMNRWGGMIGGLGAGLLIASLFGGHLGGFGAGLGMLLNLVIVAGLLYLAYRFLFARRASPSTMQFAGAGGPHRPIEPSFSQAAPLAVMQSASIPVPPGFDIEPFMRQAESAFIRLQAANDDRDLADIRSTTTPEMYAELAMQIRERGELPQTTEVVEVHARLIEAVTQDDHIIASLRYTGRIREAVGAPALPFDEVWHLRSAANAPQGPWMIAGIQQVA